jgi:hypothetical protein
MIALPYVRWTEWGIRVKTRVEVDIDGHRCVRAVADVTASEVIFALEGTIGSTPDRHTVQLGPGLHLHPTGNAIDSSGEYRHPWMYTNHSCAPNAKVVDRAMVSIRGIRAGEEITFDYDTTEYDMASPFECHCENPGCRGMIRGYKHLGPRERERLAACVNPSLLALAETETLRAGSAD